ncbi:ISAs1 family transposase [Escherichia coli]|uniref:ISAs1 family transposase n=1 Tax=Escherichia coli TaxID=562 RepID=UPI00202BADD1|nr:ISAs1 family transposase [Escherichia coli]
MEHISIIPDYRQAWKVEHKLSDILLLTICAVISGAEGWEDIEDFGETHLDFLKQYGDFENGIPVHDTIARVVSCISPSKFHECFINWMRDCHTSDDKDVIAIDGKTLRHSYDKSRRKGAIHVISAFSTMHSLVIGQIRTDEKSNEITAIPELLNMLDIKGKIITTDAMGCQKDIAEKIQHQLQQLIRLPGQQYDEESGLYYNRHRYYDPLQGRYITQDPIGLKGGWNFYQYPLNPVQYIDSMGLASKYGHLNNGGYGARPNKPPTPDPSKLPDIAKQLRLPYPIDQASSAPNVFKTFFRALSPYDYTLYCRKWVKPNLTCTPQDDSQYPGMDTKTASDYLPQTNWPTTQLPPGYTCAEPYLFPDINKPDGPATAGIDDLGEILAKMKQRTSRGIRK